MDFPGLISQIFDRFPMVRYVAFRWDDAITKDQRPELKDASGSESDFYEEHLVNPALLLLASQRELQDWLIECV